MADRIDDMNDDNVQHGIDDDPHDDGKKGLELGALGGGTVGAIAGLAAGPIGAIVGAIVGGTAGSIASGAAVDAVDSVDNDNTVTGIGGDSTRDMNDRNMHGSGMTAERLHERGDDMRESGVTAERLRDTNVAAAPVAGAAMVDTTRTNADGTVVELAAEELHVDKTRQQAGEVEIHKEVVQEQVEIPVTLEHEEVVVTRRAVDGAANSGDIGADEEVVRIPVSEEVANVSKTARVVEEVEVEKRVVTENQTVSGTVRHEELDMDDSTKNRM